MKSALFQLFLGILFAANFARANEFLRPTSIESLSGEKMTKETATHVSGARVAWADYAKIRRDFPKVEKLSDEEINTWLVKNFAYIGSNQSKLNGIRNSKIPVDEGDTKFAYRQEGANRSALLEAKDPYSDEVAGIMDAKGFGHGALTDSEVARQVSAFHAAHGNPDEISKLRIEDHNDGLMSAGEANAETTRQKAAQALFERQALPLESVESYAILVLPVDILKDGDKSISAALYLRQASVGRKSDLPVPNEIYTDPFGHKQQTRFGTAIDSGGVLIQDKRLKHNFESTGDINNPQAAKAWIYGHETAVAYGNGDENSIKHHIDEMVAPLENAPLTDEEKTLLAARHEYQEAMMKKAASITHLPYDQQLSTLVKFQTEQPFFLNGFDHAIQNHYDDFVIRTLARPDISPKLIEKALDSNVSNYPIHAADVLSKRTDSASLPAIEKALKSRSPLTRIHGASALSKRTNAPASTIELALEAPERDIKIFGAIAATGRNDVDPEKLQLLAADPDEDVRYFASKALASRTSSVKLDVVPDCDILQKIIPKPELQDH